MSSAYLLAAIAVCSLCTILTRAVPFLLFGGKKQPPKTITYLGKLLPYTVMAILVIYCLRSIQFSFAGGFVPQLSAVAVTVLLHLWKRNNLLSIAGGTLFYMFLVQSVFS